ncbi:MAG: tyrosine-type recombinase/integrase [Deltaproteobacteria bacterium]|nr:tyrosine-type recombinase/integrase [Deltaproteobacteria bacterium]
MSSPIRSRAARKLKLVVDNDADAEAREVPPKKPRARTKRKPAATAVPGGRAEMLERIRADDALVPLPPGIAADDDSLLAFASRYYAWMTQTHYSKTSIKTKRELLDRFFEWAYNRGIETLADVTPGVMMSYQKSLFEHRNAKTGRALAVRTQIHFLEGVRTFYKWLLRKRFISTNPATAIDMPRMPFRLPKVVFTLEEVEKILAGIDITRPAGLRDRTVFEVLYGAGVRRVELRRIKVRDVDFGHGVIRILGKGNKERIVPVGERALFWIKKYLDEARHLLLGAEMDPEFLFITIQGRPLSLDHLTSLTGKHVAAAKLGKGGACHAFRHSFATHLLDADTDVRMIQAMLGHALIETTALYTHVAVKKLKEVHAAKHPAARLPAAPAKPKKPPEGSNK